MRDDNIDRIIYVGLISSLVVHDLDGILFLLGCDAFVMKNKIEKYRSYLEKGNDSGNHYEFVNDMLSQVEKFKANINKASELRNTIVNSLKDGNSANIAYSIDKLFVKAIGLVKGHTNSVDILRNFEVDKDTIINHNYYAFLHVIVNLLRNSIQAYGDENGKIEINVTENEGRYIFSIKDYAGGIPEKIKEGLFENICTTKENGTGLGMYISNMLVKQILKGDLHYESEIGKGTTFYISILRGD